MVNWGLRDHRLLFPWKPGGHQGAKVTLRLGLKVDTAAWMGLNVLEEPCALETCVSTGIWEVAAWALPCVVHSPAWLLRVSLEEGIV